MSPAGRPPLEIGEAGEHWHADVTRPGRSKKTVTAYCNYRGIDGHTAQYQASGDSKAAASRALRAKLSKKTASATDEITPDTRVKVVATHWLADIDTAVEAGDRSPSTAAAYRSFLDRHVLPALGELRLREVSTGRVDAVLVAIKAKSGAATAKSCRSVLSGVLGWAARRDAVTTNATRNTSPISTKTKHPAVALSVEQVGRWMEKLAADENAVRHDLFDLTGFMIGTGCRIGEAVALQWEDLDLIGTDMLVDGAVRRVCTVRIDWTLFRVKGVGLVRKSTKSAAGLRTLRLPSYVVIMLRRRLYELHVLKTGLEEGMCLFCRFPGQLPQGSQSTEYNRRSDGVLNLSPQVRGTAGRSGVSPGHSVAGDSVDCVDSVDGIPCDHQVRAAMADLGPTPVFPDSIGGWRDPSNTNRQIRMARGEEFSWVTSHVFRKTAATLLDQAGLTARQIANVLGHSRISLTQDYYLARGLADSQAADALDSNVGQWFSLDKSRTVTFNEEGDTA